MPTKAMKKKKPRLVRIGWAPLFEGCQIPRMEYLSDSEDEAWERAEEVDPDYKIVPIYAEIPGE